MSGQDEEELAMLLQAAIVGDDKAYVAFLRRTGAIVRGFARRKIVDSSLDPEDIVQETLLAIHTKRHTWMSDAPVLPWIFAIARFKLIDAFRKRGRRMEIDIGDIIETVAQEETETVNDRDMRRVIDGLAPGQRSVVSAISIEGHSIRETAAKYGMTETAVRVALHRGLRSIAKKFGRS